MQISISEDRKRFLISAGAALVVHIIVLILIGVSRSEYDYTPEFGPVSVRISLERPNERVREPEPVESFEPEAAPKAVAAAEPELVPATPEPVPEPVPESVNHPAASNSPPLKSQDDVKPTAKDDSFLEALKSRSSGNSGGIDARAVFGDNPVPSTTESSTETAASRFADDSAGSEVVLSDALAAEVKQAVSESSEVSDVSLIDSGTMSRLDKSLESVNQADSSDPGASNTVVKAEKPVNGSLTGNSPVFTFQDPSVSRELLSWAPPEIPENVQKAGIPLYKIEIEFYIDSDGFTSGARVVKTSGDTSLDAAVQKALRGWQFEDASSEQKKVRATLTYVIEIK